MAMLDLKSNKEAFTEGHRTLPFDCAIVSVADLEVWNTALCFF